MYVLMYLSPFHFQIAFLNVWDVASSFLTDSSSRFQIIPGIQNVSNVLIATNLSRKSALFETMMSFAKKTFLGRVQSTICSTLHFKKVNIFLQKIRAQMWIMWDSYSALGYCKASTRQCVSSGLFCMHNMWTEAGYW